MKFDDGRLLKQSANEPGLREDRRRTRKVEWKSLARRASRLLSSLRIFATSWNKGVARTIRREDERLINLKVIRPPPGLLLPSFSSFFFFYTEREFIARLNRLDSISRSIASLTFMRDVVPSFRKTFHLRARVSPPCNCHAKVSGSHAFDFASLIEIMPIGRWENEEGKVLRRLLLIDRGAISNGRMIYFMQVVPSRLLKLILCFFTSLNFTSF